MGERSIPLTDLTGLMRRKIGVLLLAAVLAGLIGLLASVFLLDPVYEAGAKLLVTTRTDPERDVTNDQLLSAEKLAGTYAVVLCSRPVLEPVLENLGLEEDCEALQKRVSAALVDGTQVMELTVRADTAREALAIVQGILQTAPAYLEDTVAAGTVKLVEGPYAPDSPVSPHRALNTVLAALLGLGLSAAAVVFRCLLDRRYRSEEELRRDLDLPVLAVFPEAAGKTGGAV